MAALRIFDLRYPHLSLLLLKGGDSVKTIAAGIPNLTFGVARIGQPEIKSGNTLYKGDGTQGNFSSWGGGGQGLYFDASRASSVYGLSTTVQPPALALVPQIKFYKILTRLKVGILYVF